MRILPIPGHGDHQLWYACTLSFLPLPSNDDKKLKHNGITGRDLYSGRWRETGYTFLTSNKIVTFCRCYLLLARADNVERLGNYPRNDTSSSSPSLHSLVVLLSLMPNTRICYCHGYDDPLMIAHQHHDHLDCQVLRPKRHLACPTEVRCR